MLPYLVCLRYASCEHAMPATQILVSEQHKARESTMAKVPLSMNKVHLYRRVDFLATAGAMAWHCALLMWSAQVVGMQCKQQKC